MGIGSNPPPGIRLGTGVAGAKSDKALASSGIFPAGQKAGIREGNRGTLLSVSSMSAQLAHCILERKRAYTSPYKSSTVY